MNETNEKVIRQLYVINWAQGRRGYVDTCTGHSMIHLTILNRMGEGQVGFYLMKRHD